MDRFLTLILFLLLSCSVFSQSIIQGQILEELTGEPLINVNILLEGSYLGTSTDENGEFILTMKKTPPFMLLVSYIGYETQQIHISESRTELNILMVEKPYTTNEIIVTPQHREQQLQEVPLSVSVVDKNFIQSTNQMYDAGDLIHFIPGFSGSPWSEVAAEYTIRGINRSSSWASLASSSTAVLLDGVYFGSIFEAARDFIDVERIELLKGPQSTLFGRNSSAGVISVHSNKPVFTDQMSVGFNFGNLGHKEAKLVFNTPVNDKLAIRYAGQWSLYDGYLVAPNLDNHPLDNKNTLTNRLSFYWKPSGYSNYWLTLEHQRNRGLGLGGGKNINEALGSSPDLYDSEHELNFPDFFDSDLFTTTLNSKWLLGEKVALHSITAVGSNKLNIKVDGDGTPTDLFKYKVIDSTSTFTQEFRLTGASHRLDWLIASNLNYLKDKGQTGGEFNDFYIIPFYAGLSADFCDGNPACVELNPEIGFRDLSHLSLGVFGQFSYALAPQLKGNFGVRYSLDKKNYDGHVSMGIGAINTIFMGNLTNQPIDFSIDKTWTSVQPKASLSYKINDSAMLFGGYSRGYIAGGFPLNSPEPFEPETSNAYEIGLKSNLSNDRIKMNVTAYYIDYSDLQVQVFINRIPVVTNAGSVESIGIELESSWVISREFDVMLNLGLNNAEYKEYQYNSPEPGDPDNVIDLSGAKVNRNPEVQFSTVVQYRKELPAMGTLQLRADFSYNTESYISTNFPEETKIDAYSLIKLSAGIHELAGGKISIGAFVSNLTDTRYITFGGEGNFGTDYSLSPPRIFGIKLGFDLK